LKVMGNWRSASSPSRSPSTTRWLIIMGWQFGRHWFGKQQLLVLVLVLLLTRIRRIEEVGGWGLTLYLSLSEVWPKRRGLWPQWGTNKWLELQWRRHKWSVQVQIWPLSLWLYRVCQSCRGEERSSRLLIFQFFSF
jgi:hypothetical protein